MNSLGNYKIIKTNYILLSSWLLFTLLGVVVLSITVSHLWTVIKTPQVSSFSINTLLKLIANLAGSYATLIAFLALCIAGVAKHIKRLWSKAFRFLSKSHLYLGWVVLGLSLLHGGFFIEHFFNPGSDRRFVIGTLTGIVTLLIAAVVVLGPYGYMKLPKNLKPRTWHRILGFTLCIAIVLHVLTLKY